MFPFGVFRAWSWSRPSNFFNQVSRICEFFGKPPDSFQIFFGDFSNFMNFYKILRKQSRNFLNVIWQHSPATLVRVAKSVDTSDF